VVVILTQGHPKDYFKNKGSGWNFSIMNAIRKVIRYDSRTS